MALTFDNNALAALDDIESLEDIPPIAVPPTGVYILEMTLEPKALDIKTGVKAGTTIQGLEFKYKLLAKVSVKNPAQEQEIVIGQSFNEFTELTPDRLKWHKEKLQAMQAMTGTKGLVELVAAFSKPIKVQATVKRTVDKNDEDKQYANVTDVEAA